jgi:predicted phage tail component-like protein
MADIIVKVPKDRNADYDYTAFSFNGKHSFEDFGLIRVSDGSRYAINLTPTLNDKTADVPGRDGMYFFGTNYKQKDFAINFVFDGLTHKQLTDMELWLDGKDLHPLWFAEEPYKVYMAKVTGTPQIKALPFDQEYIKDGVTRIKRIFKGEGSVNFTAYNPVARTPDYIEVEEKFYYCLNNIKVSDIWVNPGDKLVIYSLDNDNCIPYDKSITTNIVDSSGDSTI